MCLNDVSIRFFHHIKFFIFDRWVLEDIFLFLNIIGKILSFMKELKEKLIGYISFNDSWCYSKQKYRKKECVVAIDNGNHRLNFNNTHGKENLQKQWQWVELSDSEWVSGESLYWHNLCVIVPYFLYCCLINEKISFFAINKFLKMHKLINFNFCFRSVFGPFTKF